MSTELGVLDAGGRLDAYESVGMLSFAAAVEARHQRGWTPIAGSGVSGTEAYYSHPSHHTERWDAVRYQLRADNLLDKLLTKAGL